MVVVLINLKKFGAKSDAKLKVGVFMGPKIRELILDKEFKTHLSPSELSAWQAFVLVVQNFLSNFRAVNHAELVYNMLKAYQIMG